MDIRILGQLEGASQAEGLTVIIDVFRAFTVECFVSERGAERIIPMAKAEDCLRLKAQHPEYYLIGERGGVKLEGFDSGNSPSYLTTAVDLRGKTVVHSTSAGTQGIVQAASKADEVLTGSLVNASAIVRYIQSRKPAIVTLVSMGLNGNEESAEDTLCARYIKAKLLGEDISIHDEIAKLKSSSGSKFFDRERQKSFPEPDFFMCLVPDVFDFVLRADTTKDPIEMQRIDI